MEIRSPFNSKRSFARLNATQFLGALNDNLFKLLLIFFLIDLHGPDEAGKVAALAGGLFVVPFLLFSPLAGILADRLDKGRIIVGAKGLEVLIMLLGTAAFWRQSPAGLYLVLFLMALQSTLFSPAKYGIVPEIVGREELSRANGRLEALTYLAIILGTALATFLPRVSGGEYTLAVLACPVLAVGGLAASFGIGPSPAPHRQETGAKGFGGALRVIRDDRHLALAVAGSALFMLVGAFAQLNLIPLGMQELGLSQEQSGALFLVAALGIGLGSLCAGRLSGRNVELGVVPLGALLLFASALVLGLAPNRIAPVLTSVALLGLGGGLFIVPLHAFIQFRAPEGQRGRVLAASNFLGWTGVLGAALCTQLINGTLALPARQGFAGLGLLLLALTAPSLVLLPDFLLRFLALAAMRLVYRVRVRGAGHVPTEGGALLVANHVSWIDALLLLSTQQRRIRFLMERRIYETFFLRHLFRLMGVIPISSADGRRDLAAALHRARQALDEGCLVCIFAEGAITRTGTLQEFRPGFERIVRGSTHPVIPVHIGGVWGSLFSYRRGARTGLLPEPVVIRFGAPMPEAGAAEVRQAVMELSAEESEARKELDRSLARRFVATARRNWNRQAVSDSAGTDLTYGWTLAAALLLRSRLQGDIPAEEMVGLLLPPSAGGALANLALTLDGRVAVNLNYTAPAEALRSAIRQCGLRTVLTSRRFLEKAGELPLPEQVLHLEDLLEAPRGADRLRAWVRARFLPRRVLLRRVPRDPDALAAVLFSSGSSGEPKGVMLTQHNILSNIEALRQIFPVDGRDNLCGVLPFFHSFGYTGTLWLPLLSGFSAVYHPNPLDAGAVPRLVRRHRSTFLLATPTFLGTWMRRARPEDFASLRFVVTGAEKLSPALAADFEETFGIAPLEGYGATELSPVAAINLPAAEAGGVRQEGTRPGSVGRPLPGVAVRIVDPESRRTLPPGQPGLILFRGANVMAGYLGQPEKTAEVLREGWYVSGDIGSLDRKGFLRITGRLSRFSKIGGEMVPHGAVEELLHGELGGAEPLVAVASVPDPKKGERLVVLHTPAAGDAERLREIVEKSSLPNLWKPGRDGYLAVERIPLLGTGKVDLQALQKMASEGKA